MQEIKDRKERLEERKEVCKNVESPLVFIAMGNPMVVFMSPNVAGHPSCSQSDLSANICNITPVEMAS